MGRAWWQPSRSRFEEPFLARSTTVAGVLLGVTLSAVVTPSVRSLVFGVEQHDPAVFAGVAALVVVVAAAACYAPARRATRVDPMVALRER